MFDAHAIKQDFSRAAPDYDRHAHLQRDVRAKSLALIAPHWPAGLRILDAGSGTGALAADAKNKQWNITGLDLAFGMCALSGGINADAAAMPFADHTFDGIFSSLMLQWTYPMGVFREMLRVAKSGTRLIVSTLVHGTLAELEQSFATFDAAPHVSEFLPSGQIAAQAVHAGFTLLSAEEETKVEYYPDTLTLMRALKSIGAANKHESRRKGLMTASQLEALEAAYSEKFCHENGLPATWRILYLMLEKA